MVLVLLNGFFVAAEFALVRARRSRVEDDGRGGRRAAPRSSCTSSTTSSQYLSACQLGITLTSLGIGFLGEPAIARAVETCSATTCRTGVSLRRSRSSLAYLITTSLHITIGEQVPKIYAINKAERVARRIARPLHVFTQVFRPFIHVLNAASNGILRRSAISTTGRVRRGRRRPRSCKVLIAQSLTGGKLDAGRGGHAHRRLPPARAAGAPGDDARARRS